MSLSTLIQEGEGNQLEFLVTVNDQKKFAQTICAFANTAGGSVLIGVKENGKITGIDPSAEFDVIQNAVERYCLPVVELDIKTWQEDRHLVLQITVIRGEEQVRCLSDDGSYKAYIRVESETILANKIIIGMWKFQQKEFPCPTEFSKETIKLNNDVNLDQVMAWKNEQFYFDRVDIKTMMRQIEKYYNVEIEYRDNINYKFIAKISRQVNVSVFLKKLELTELVHFNIEANKIIIMK